MHQYRQQVHQDEAPAEAAVEQIPAAGEENMAQEEAPAAAEFVPEQVEVGLEVAPAPAVEEEAAPAEAGISAEAFQASIEQEDPDL